jgi:outer membrane immunogenic protein
MRNILIAFGIFGLTTSTASAEKPWTGFYIGAHGGYASGEVSGNLQYDPGLGPVDLFQGKPGRSIDIDGGFGGVQLGFNQQSGQFVYGLEIDASWGDVKGSSTFAIDTDAVPDGVTDYTWKIAPKVDAFGTVRGRLGMLVNPGLLIYGTGGLAYGKVSADQTVTGFPPQGFNPPQVTAIASSSQNMIGWTAGGGAELQMGGGWSLKAEYLYVDLGSVDLRFKGTAYPGQPAGNPLSGCVPNCSFPHTTDSLAGADVTFHTVKMGLNYKF